VSDTRFPGLTHALDEAPISRFHLHAALVSGVGFFTDAYDLFVIGIAATLIRQQWQLSSGRLALLSAVMLSAACLGALVFGRVADLIGRKRVYWLVAVIMVVGALGSAVSPGYWVLIAFRFVLGFGVGGDYPVSAVLMSEYANRENRGRLVGLVFSTQALGLIVGPVIALALLGAGAGNGLAWRLMLALGAVPAAAVVYLRRKMPESPRFQAQVQGRYRHAVADLARFTDGTVTGNPVPAITHQMGLRAFLTNRRWLLTLAGTAGCWFLLDYAYYGNTISTPQIIGLISPQSSTMTTIAIQLAIFVVAAVPGYLLGIARLDRVGHRRLQLIGFAMMALCFAVIGLVPGLTTAVVPFLLVYGVSYFFTEFGPNMTTFVLPSEVFPVTMRATGHGISAGVGKLGAFIGVFLFPLLASSLGLRGTLLLTAVISGCGLLLTLVLPEPAGRSLEEVSSGEAEPGPVLAVGAGEPGAGGPGADDPSAPIVLDAEPGGRPDSPPDRAA
jgi:PHS family inorganic phosphate transporter-like MFS transporter